jgi:hypothetical protein
MKLRYILVALLILIICICIAVYLLSSKTKPGTSTNNTNVFPATNANNNGSTNITPKPGQRPDAFALDFYTWYINGLVKNSGFRGSQEFVSSAPNLLTQDFIQKLDSLEQNTDQNPLILAQDYGSSWIENIHATTLSETTNQSLVTVTFGTGQDFRKITVDLVRSNAQDTWKIASVSP